MWERFENQGRPSDSLREALYICADHNLVVDPVLYPTLISTEGIQKVLHLLYRDIMASSPIRTVVVTGATGGQGGAIIDVLLTTPPFPVHIKGTTRNLSSPAAQSLTSRGVEMVHADYDDPSTLRAAFQNAWAIYAVTDFWQLFASNTSAPEAAMEQEYTHGTNLARAAAEVETLKHYIWSTVPSAQDISNGSCSVLHFDSKSLVDKFIRRELKESLYPKTTMLWVPFYAKNLQWLPMWKPSFDVSFNIKSHTNSRV